MKKFSLLLAVIMLLSCACSAFAQEPTEAPVGANEVMNIRGKQVDQEAAAAEEAFLKSDCAFSVIEADEATGQVRLSYMEGVTPILEVDSLKFKDLNKNCLLYTSLWFCEPLVRYAVKKEQE